MLSDGFRAPKVLHGHGIKLLNFEHFGSILTPASLHQPKFSPTTRNLGVAER